VGKEAKTGALDPVRHFQSPGGTWYLVQVMPDSPNQILQPSSAPSGHRSRPHSPRRQTTTKQAQQPTTTGGGKPSTGRRINNPIGERVGSKFFAKPPLAGLDDDQSE